MGHAAFHYRHQKSTDNLESKRYQYLASFYRRADISETGIYNVIVRVYDRHELAEQIEHERIKRRSTEIHKLEIAHLRCGLCHQIVVYGTDKVVSQVSS